MSAPSDLTLRDYFAGLAMTAWAAKFDSDEHKHLAGMAYEIADAMLAERAKAVPHDH
jgi:hypothetical protein